MPCSQTSGSGAAKHISGGAAEHTSAKVEAESEIEVDEMILDGLLATVEIKHTSAKVESELAAALDEMILDRWLAEVEIKHDDYAERT